MRPAPIGEKFGRLIVTADLGLQPVGQKGERMGCRRTVISDRIGKLGWSVERTLTTPVREQRLKGE